jgi:DNA-binding NtrC family response regulator
MRSIAQTEATSCEQRDHDLLVIDDDSSAIQLVAKVLESEGFRVHGATSAAAGLDLLARWRPPIVLLDLVLPGIAGMELLEQILAIDPGIDVILVTGHYSTDSAVEAIQKGAYDYLTKPLPIERLRQKLRRWVADSQMRQRTLSLDGELLRAFQLEGIVGRSPLMLEVFSKIRRIAPHFTIALVTGESGTGKESAAKALHQLSPYASGPFIVCNCAAIPENLFESELFGHTRGAFTGAAQDKQGFVEAACGGTLFLDEITEIPLGAQAKLLRLLQNREIQRVGTSRATQVDVRIVAATNRDLRALVADNKLREDLYYRLSMIEVKMPRLAERREDLPLLQRHFLNRFSAHYNKPTLNLARRAQAIISRHSWPGNIRELENVLGYACMITESESIDVRELPDYLQSVEPSSRPEDEVRMSMKNVELRHLHRVLVHVGGNRNKAAGILGISRTTMYRILEEEKKSGPFGERTSELAAQIVAS